MTIPTVGFHVSPRLNLKSPFKYNSYNIMSAPSAFISYKISCHFYTLSIYLSTSSCIFQWYTWYYCHYGLNCLLIMDTKYKRICDIVKCLWYGNGWRDAKIWALYCWKLHTGTGTGTCTATSNGKARRRSGSGGLEESNGYEEIMKWMKMEAKTKATAKTNVMDV